LVKDPDRFTRSLAYLRNHLEEKVSDQIELTHPTHRVLDRYTGPVYKRDGTLFGRIEVYTDVTEVHQLQRNKDEFLAVVSHELKAPVTSIKGYAQLLGRRTVREYLQATTISSLGVIERQANRMQQLIETLLDLSRWDLGKLKFEPQ
jgi:signal transduction histidine kinase